MIWNQMRLLRNRRFIFTAGCVIAIAFIILIYQEKNSAMVNRAHCIQWAMSFDEPLEALERHFEDLLQTDSLVFTGSLYDEVVLTQDSISYFENVLNYHAQMENIISSRKNATSFFTLTPYEIKKNELEIEYYSSILNEVNVVPGNYIAYESFFSFGVIDVASIILVYLICNLLIVNERERDMGKLVFSTKHGGKQYFYCKFAGIFLGCIILTVCLNIVKLLVLLKIYGTADASVSIQSMSGYFSSPWNISIRQYVILTVIWKTIGMAAIALIITVICSLAISEVGTGVVSFLIFAGNILFVQIFPNESKYVIFRDGSPIGCYSAEYWISALRVYPILQIGDKVILAKTFFVPFISFGLLAILLFVLGMKIYSGGLRKSSILKKIRNGKSPVCYRNGLFWNELIQIFLRKKAILFAGIMLALYSGCICNFYENNSEQVQMEKQIVVQLNKLEFSEAVKWIADKENELDGYEESLQEKQRAFMNGEISESEYIQYNHFVVNQFRIRPILDSVRKQADDMEKYMLLYPQKTLKFEYSALSQTLFSENGSAEKAWISFFISVFVIFMLMVNLPDEKENGIYLLLCCSANGARSMKFRKCIMIFSVFLFSMALYGIWLWSLDKQYGLIGWNDVSESWRCFRGNVLFHCVGENILAEVLIQSIIWAIIGEIGIMISSTCSNIVLSELVGISIFAFPCIIRILGGKRIDILPWVRYMFFGERIMSTSLLSAFICIGVAVGVYYLAGRGIERWIKRKIS